jgi:type II secretory pathway pseudopilin PulG
MKFASIGTRAPPRSLPRDRNSRAGFTLVEALAALTLILAFAAVLAPLLFHARRIMVNADGRVAAQILLRSLLQEPIDRAPLANRSGEGEGLQWQVRIEPSAIAASLPRGEQRPQGQKSSAREPATPWVAYRVVASVSWAPGQSVSAETLRLGKTE